LSNIRSKKIPKKISAQVIASDTKTGTKPLAWNLVRKRFDKEKWYWLGTTRNDGQAHIRPVLAVWLNDKIYSTTSPKARKSHNLEQHNTCSVAARAKAIDIVAEGSAKWVDNHLVLRQVAKAYKRKYGWPITITVGNMFDAPYGAPTAGPPPYRVYEITPRLVYAFGTKDNLGARSTCFHITSKDI
jgi:hypothetical protein